MKSETRLTYKSAGVDIAAQDRALEMAKGAIRRTFTQGVLGDVGSFGGLFDPAAVGMRDSILVSSADGVGTKLQVARQAGIHDTVGQCLVNHCVNDVLVQGARPLFFFDYAAMGKLDSQIVADLITGCARACEENQMALLGGETAEMPGVYEDGDFELVGFLVGAVQREHLVDGSRVRPGQALIGLPSNGLHTNGYSLARRILFEVLGLGLDDTPDEFEGRSVAQELLRVHRPYQRSLMPLIEADRISAMAHITGGGIPGNLPRVLGATDAEIDREAWGVPGVFELLVRAGELEREEAFRAFNMGVGMILAVEEDDGESVLENLSQAGEKPFPMGRLVAGKGKVRWSR